MHILFHPSVIVHGENNDPKENKYAYSRAVPVKKKKVHGGGSIV